MKTERLRIGITMRVGESENYQEKRDIIAQDWSKYLLSIFPDAQWLLIPNIGNRVSEYVKKWKLNAFILSGGEDLGESPERDETEFAVFKYAMNNKILVLGICRGLQAIYSWMGGKVSIESEEFKKLHVAHKHKVLIGNLSREVNSYHINKLDEESLPNSLKVIATCIEDNSIEAVSGNNILAIMWHPERESNIQKWESELIRKFFNNNI